MLHYITSNSVTFRISSMNFMKYIRGVTATVFPVVIETAAKSLFLQRTMQIQVHLVLRLGFQSKLSGDLMRLITDLLLRKRQHLKSRETTPPKTTTTTKQNNNNKHRHNHHDTATQNRHHQQHLDQENFQLVSQLVGALSPVSHRGLHQGQAKRMKIMKK